MSESDVQLRAMLDAVNESWRRARERGPLHSRQLRIAEVDVEIAVVGDELASSLLPGFSGLPAALAAPRVTVGSWDATATEIPFPAGPPRPDAGSWRATLRRDDRPVGELDWFAPRMLGTGDRESGLHLLAVERAADILPSDAGAPLRRQLAWALGSDVHFVHAGAVGDRDGVALIIGPAGAGKSSTSLSCLRAGMGFISEDYCLIRDDPPTAYPLYWTGRLADDDLRHFDGWVDPAMTGSQFRDHERGVDAKALFLFHEVLPHRMLGRAPVRVVLIPDHDHRDVPGLEPMNRAAALRFVAPKALVQLHIEPDRELRALARVFASVPCFRLRLSPDRTENPRYVREALNRARASPTT